MVSESERYSSSTVPRLSADRPIEDSAEDTLERASSAQSFARDILTLDFSRGLVVGVLGRWGSGKTSYINLAVQAFRTAGVEPIAFNPWMFSGVDRLVDAFFAEVSSELKLLPQLKDAGKELEEYGELLSGLGWVPIIGPWAERARLALRLVGGGLKKTKGGIAARRKTVERALSQLARPVVIILDDIDRLTTEEIRQVFQLVRLTASFPNIIYVLAFDRARVEQALTEAGVPGRAYLEKILQLAIDLPITSPEALQSQIFDALNAALSGVDGGVLDQNVWPNLFFEIIQPVLTTMRDVRRYALVVRGTVAALDKHVALADVLALEAVRVFMPDVFNLLPQSVDALTSVREGYDDRGPTQHHKAAIDAIIEAAGDRSKVARAMLKELFPASRQHFENYHYGHDWKARWLRERRVAHESLLRLYLERVPSAQLKAHLGAERTFKVLNDASALAEHLRRLDPKLLEDTIAGLEVFEEGYRAEHVVPGVVTLLNLLSDIPERPRGMFDFGSKLKVTRVTYRLLRSLKNPVEVERAVRAILPQLKHLSSKWEVITDVGHREGAGHRLVSPEAAAALESAWRSEVRSADIERLAADPDLLRVIAFTQQDAVDGEPNMLVPESPRITHQLLRSARHEILSQSIESYAVRREPRLAWESLERAVGGDAKWATRVDDLLGGDEALDASLRELVEKYRKGWRPKND